MTELHGFSRKGLVIIRVIAVFFQNAKIFSRKYSDLQIIYLLLREGVTKLAPAFLSLLWTELEEGLHANYVRGAGHT